MRLGIDFGTSNTAAAVMAGPRPFLIEVEAGETTLPTAVFIDPIAKRTLYGHAAVRALIEGQDGRFLRALKSVLGTSLMRESRLIGHERTTLMEMVARFLARVKHEAEAKCYQTFDTVLSGRPVHFHSIDKARDAQAEIDLAECYAMAGFKSVDFMFEPEAAALACGGAGAGYGLVVDIGGGTSDFTVFRGAAGAIDVIASHGVRIGGTDFDRAISIASVMPLLGMGTGIKAEIGSAVHAAPARMFNELATWEKIPFVYAPEVQRDVARMAKLAQDTVAFGRLVEVLEAELGHEIAFSVERGKIMANKPDAQGVIDLRMIERDLSVPLGAEMLGATLSELSLNIGAAAAQTIDQAGLKPVQIDKIILVGGSSLMGAVEGAVRAVVPDAEIERSDAFTAIVNGLAIATER